MISSSPSRLQIKIFCITLIIISYYTLSINSMQYKNLIIILCTLRLRSSSVKYIEYRDRNYIILCIIQRQPKGDPSSSFYAHEEKTDAATTALVVSRDLWKKRQCVSDSICVSQLNHWSVTSAGYREPTTENLRYSCRSDFSSRCISTTPAAIRNDDM